MQSIRVPIKPELITWARERAGYSIDELTKKFKKLPEWESGQSNPTLNQVAEFAKKVHVPEGYLYFNSPPEELIPISDFRTFSGKRTKRPSPNLLSTIFDCELRQDWYREFAIEEGLPKLNFIGTASLNDPPAKVAQRIISTINFDLKARRSCATWLEALRYFIRQVDETGILVMVSGIVRSNTHRRLDPEEFRGFVLSDTFAPLIFVNGADTKAAQIFTLAHELAHLWLGESALSNSGITIDSKYAPEEIWCNAVAAEMLVPLKHLKRQLPIDASLDNLVSQLAKLYKVSTLVILRRLFDVGYLNENQFQQAWNIERSTLKQLSSESSGGGNFYHTTIVRVGYRFAYALTSSTNVGKTLTRDACRLLGITRVETMKNLTRELGVIR